MLTALNSTGVMVPQVVMAENGQELWVIRACPLGAADALFWRARDAGWSAWWHAQQQTRAARRQQKLDRQLEAAQRELECRVRDLTIRGAPVG